MLRHGARSIAPALALLSAGCGEENPIAAGECVKPSLISEAAAPNPANALSALVSVKTVGADSIVVHFGRDEALGSATPASVIVGDAVLAPILGLYPETSYRARVTAFNRCGTTDGGLLTFVTDSVPSDLPSYLASGSSSEGPYVVFAAGKYGIVIDNTGRVVWYHRFANGPGLNFQAQPNGRYTARPAPDPGKPPGWIEIDPLGDTTRTLTCSGGLAPRMHDMIAQPDGSYWLLCDETRTVDLSAQGRSSNAQVMGTGAQLRNAAGDVVFAWSPFDHLQADVSILDSQDRNSNPINWTHGNSIDVDSDGNLLLSFRNLSQVIKVNTQTGAVMWRMGGAGNQFSFESLSLPAFTRQHGVRSVGAGQIELLDNLGEAGGSRAERYALDPANRTARLIGVYASSASLVAQIGGSTQALAGGNVLVSFGNGGGVEEYNSDGDVVWRLAGNPGYVFRAQRIRSLYRPGFGDPR